MAIKEIGPRRWQVRIQYRDPRTGAKRSLERTVEGARREAQRVEAKLREQAASGSRHQRVRLSTFAASWLLARKRTVKPSVSTRYAMALQHHIIPRLGGLYMDRIAPSDVTRYVADRLDEGAAGNTVRNEIQVLRTMAADSVAEGASKSDWTARVPSPPVARWTEERPNLLTAEQLAAVLAAVPARWRTLVELMAFTGLRWGEASGLRWGDVDELQGIIRVRRSNWRGRSVTPKTETSLRTVPLPPSLVGRLRPLKGDLLFPNEAGDLNRGFPLVKVMQRACKAAGVQYVTPHGLRRTYNNLARQVASREVVRSITGHTTDRMFEHYSLVGHGEKREATRRVLELVTTAQDPDGAKTERENGDD